MEDSIMATQVADAQTYIRKIDDQIGMHIADGDAAGFAGYYTENATLLPPDSDFVHGKKAITKFWQGVIDMGIRKVKLDIKEVETLGDTALEIGQYTLGGVDGKTIDKGKYIVEWKHEQGQWKLHRDMWNSSQLSGK